jgi:hypothetical protein
LQVASAAHASLKSPHEPEVRLEAQTLTVVSQKVLPPHFALATHGWSIVGTAAHTWASLQ